ncbi:MAG: ABC transporter ATP-binding protein [Candidatus Melainabacteria bacterium]|nr:ABC transporter ATP-binding protein [Candidatus Melainabacteria bacterium]
MSQAPIVDAYEEQDETTHPPAMDATVQHTRFGGWVFTALAPWQRDFSLLKALWPLLMREKKALFLSTLMLPLLAMTQAAQPFLLQQAIDGPIQRRDWPGLLVMVLLLLLLLAVAHWLRYWQMAYSQTMGTRIITNLRQQLYEHLQRLSLRFYGKTPLGRLMTRLTNDVENLSEMLASGGISILSDLAIIVGAIVGMWLMHPVLATLMMLVLVLLAFITQFFRVHSRRAYDDIRHRLAALNTYLQESLDGLDLIQTTHQQAATSQRLGVLNQQSRNANLRSVVFDWSYTAAVECLTFIAMLLTLLVGALTLGLSTVEQVPLGLAQLVSALPALTFGQLVAFFQFIPMLFNPVEDLSQKAMVIQSGLSSFEKLSALLETPVEITQSPEAVSLPPTPGEIRFDNVSFYYDDPAHPVLSAVSFSFAPRSDAEETQAPQGEGKATASMGRVLALVGPSGSGKTTLVRLLNRFYDATSGQVTLHGHDVRQIDLASLRRHVIVLQQSDWLFSATVAENIALGEDAPDDDKLNRAVSMANLQPLLARLPQGLHSPLLEGGKNLSNGERQLLLLARAFYANPPVLVLDEATAAVDPATERLIQSALQRLMADRTTIVIAHRLSTIESADTILFLEQGRVMESGSHASLMAANGHYARYYRYQTEEGALQG